MSSSYAGMFFVYEELNTDSAFPNGVVLCSLYSYLLTWCSERYVETTKNINNVFNMWLLKIYYIP